MELKRAHLLRRAREGHRFNRTFMELKHTILSSKLWIYKRFNRTFMELKRELSKFLEPLNSVLIGPSWN